MPTLVVQLGHCYRKTGATGTTGEQEYATKVGNACRALLHGRGGWSVRVILADDPASTYEGDAFFAIHCDGSTSPAARGASVGYRTPEGQTAAQAWKRAYAARGWPGFRPDNYTTALQGYYGTGTAVARGNRRAVILECGFRTNAEDRAQLDGTGGVDRVALSIGDALGIPVTPPEDDMTPDEHNWLKAVFDGIYNGGPSTPNGRPLAILIGDAASTKNGVQALSDGFYKGGPSTPGNLPLADLIGVAANRPGMTAEQVADLASQVGDRVIAELDSRGTTSVTKADMEDIVLGAFARGATKGTQS